MKIKLLATICILFFLTLAFLPNISFAQRKTTTKIQVKPTPQKRDLKPRSDVVNVLPTNSKRYALIVGVDQYEDTQISKLEGATNDAKTLAEALTKNAGFLPDQVKVLTNDQTVERRPTRANILRSLSNLIQTMPRDGLLLISFAGHGIERDGKAFLLPTDAQLNSDINLLEDTALPAERISNLIKQSGIKQVLILLDACRSNPETGRGFSEQTLTNAYTKSFNFEVRNNQITAFAVLYATGKGQKAYEYREKKQGYFSWALVEGLKGKATNDKGEVTLSSLLKFVQEFVPKQVSLDIGKQQVPFAVIEGYKADELVLAVYPVQKVNSQTAELKPIPQPTPEPPKPSPGEDLALRGVEKFNKGDFNGAISDFLYAIDLDPKNATNYKVALAKSYSQRAISKYQQANYEGANIDITKAIETSPQPDTAFYNIRGVLKTELKQYDQALADFNKAIEINPNLAILYSNRGNVYERNGEKKKANQDYEKAKQIDPNIFTPNTNYKKDSPVMKKVSDLIDEGYTKFNKGDYDGAINNFTYAINLNPKYEAPYYLRGNAKILKEFFVGFFTDYENAYRTGNTRLNEDVYKILAIEATKTIESNPPTAINYLKRALLFIARGDCGKAKKDLDRAIELDQNLYLGYVVRSTFNENGIKGRLKDLDKAVSLQPNSASAYFIRGWFREQLGKSKEAAPDYEKAIQLTQEDSNLLSLFLKRTKGQVSFLFTLQS